MNRYVKTSAVVAACLVVLATTVGAADRVRVANEGKIGDEWMLADGVSIVAPGYPAEFSERGESVCIAIGYMITPDGTTTDYSVLKVWNSSGGNREPAKGFWGAFTNASAAALSEWKFKPRPEVTSVRPTFTVATMNFMGKDQAGRGELKDRCAISDLAYFIQNGKWKRTQNLNTVRLDQERLTREINGTRALVENPGMSGHVVSNGR